MSSAWHFGRLAIEGFGSSPLSCEYKWLRLALALRAAEKTRARTGNRSFATDAIPSNLPRRLYLHCPNSRLQLEGPYELQPGEIRDGQAVWRTPTWGVESNGAVIYSDGGRWRCAPAGKCGPSGRPGAWILSSASAHESSAPSAARFEGSWLRREGRGDCAHPDPDVIIHELHPEDSYAQFGQDVRAMGDRVFAGRCRGTFLDIGAGDGVEGSNTCLMERKFGWTGICIEARSKLLPLLKVNRPSSTCICEVLWSEGGISKEFVYAGNASGLVDSLDVHKGIRKKRISSLLTKTLENVLVDCEAPNWIDYMSLDTEGSELEILKGVDWQRRAFGYLTIEHNYVSSRRLEIRKFLLERGYSLVCECFVDDEYAHPSFLLKEGLSQ